MIDSLFLFSLSVGASIKTIQDETTSTSCSTSNSHQSPSSLPPLNEVVSKNPDPDHHQPSSAKENQPPPSAPEASTAENTPVKTSAASKAAAFFTSGKMSSSSSDLKKSKPSPEGTDSKFNISSLCVRLAFPLLPV